MVTCVLFTCLNDHIYWSQEVRLSGIKLKSTCSCAFLLSYYESPDHQDATCMSTQRSYVHVESV